MPKGISSSFTAPVVLMSALMPLIGGCAQAPVQLPAPDVLAVAESGDGFVIRRAPHQAVAPSPVRLGASVHFDRALIGPADRSNVTATHGENLETR
jgi:hypothetical protein